METAALALEIESHDARTASDAVLRELHALDVAFDAEAQPDEPPTPFETYRSRYRSMPSYRDTTAWLATAEGRRVGAAYAEFDRSGTNAHVIEAFIEVDAGHRRRGVARSLLGALLDAAEAERRTQLLGYTASTVPAGAEFMRWLGATPGLEERESELVLDTLERDLVTGWVDDAPRRAPDYELVMIEGDVPEELLEPYAILYSVSNTAPRDALDVEDSHRTPEQIRENDRSRRDGGAERILCFARHRGTGALAGWSELGRHPHEPWKVHQFWTAVHPDHRGHALGKWLKAANILRCLERWPDARKIVTGNAYSNDAMLGINNALGFRETLGWTVWQVSIADVRSRLAR